MDNAADHTAIFRPFDAPDIPRQVRFDPLPLLFAEPKQVPTHDPNPLPKRIGIVLSERIGSLWDHTANPSARAIPGMIRVGRETFQPDVEPVSVKLDLPLRRLVARLA